MALFNTAEKERIAARIAAAERATAAEIVVSTVGQSDRYLDVRLASAAAFTLFVSAVVHLVWPGLTSGEILALQLGTGVLGFVLSGVPTVLRAMLPKQRAREAVQREAGLHFLEHGVFATRDRNGVLILLSELEHNVTILGDEGIHARVAGLGWEDHVKTIVAAVRGGRAAEGVCTVIDKLSALFAEHEPVRSDDTNELANHVRERL